MNNYSNTVEQVAKQVNSAAIPDSHSYSNSLVSALILKLNLLSI